jgi:hypothetical protein
MSAAPESKRSERIRFDLFDGRKTERVRMRVERLQVRPEPPEVAEISRGILAVEKTADRRPLGARGVCDESGSVFSASVSLRGKQVSSKRDAPPRELLDRAPLQPGTAYYLGDLRHHNAHYGHFLLETLSRAWDWSEARTEAKLMVLGARMPDFARRFYAVLFGSADRVTLVNRTTRFERIVVPAPAFVLDRHVHVQFKELCDRIAGAVGGEKEARSEQPVYISRSGLDPASCRTILGEELFERVLAGEGFRIVRPEAMSIDDQIRLFNRHRNVVASMGSACHTRLFSLSASTLVVLCAERVDPNYILCDLLNSGPTRYVRVLSAPELPGAEGLPPFATPLLLDLESAIESLKKIGLVRPRTQPDAVAPGLEEYRIRWIQIAKTLSRRPESQRLRDSIERLQRGSLA